MFLTSAGAVTNDDRWPMVRWSPRRSAVAVATNDNGELLATVQKRGRWLPWSLFLALRRFGPDRLDRGSSGSMAHDSYSLVATGA